MRTNRGEEIGGIFVELELIHSPTGSDHPQVDVLRIDVETLLAYGFPSADTIVALAPQLLADARTQSARAGER